MREISFHSFNSAWAKSFIFDSLCGLTIGNLKQLLMTANGNLKLSTQLLVYDGRVLESDSLLVDEVIGSSGDSEKIDFRVFSVQIDSKLSHCDTVRMDPLSVAAAKEYMATISSSPCGCFNEVCLNNTVCVEVSGAQTALVRWKALLDGLSLTTAESAASPTDATSTADVAVTMAVAPVAAAPAIAAVPVAPVGPVLPAVDWLQWGVMAKLIVVAFLFTYNRNLSTERLVHMAAMTVFSYFFQIGALSYWAVWICHKLGFEFTPPPRPLPNHNNANDENNAAGDANGGVPNGGGANAVAENNLAGPGAAPGGGGGAGVQNNVRPNNAPNNAPAVPAAPFNLVNWVNEVYHSGFTIPTAPGILMDIVALIMGLFFSIVPSWAPYRL